MDSGTLIQVLSDYMRRKLLIPFLLALALLPAANVMGEDGTAAVLTEDAGPYREAFLAFQEEYGKTIPAYDLSTYTAMPQEKVIAAFGGKAATLDYPETSLLVYCLAPGIKDRPARRRTVAIPMVPAPGQALQTIRRIQPGLRRLAVFHTSGAYARYVEELSSEGRRLNIEIIAASVQSDADIPAELRRLIRDMDAFWLLPDPLLVNKETFTTLKYFSRANHIPFYAPTSELAKKGATAAIFNSFVEIGRTAAKAAKEDVRDSSTWYPEKINYSINTTESGYIRMNIPEDVLDKAETLFE